MSDFYFYGFWFFYFSGCCLGWMLAKFNEDDPDLEFLQDNKLAKFLFNSVVSVFWFAFGLIIFVFVVNGIFDQMFPPKKDET